MAQTPATRRARTPATAKRTVKRPVKRAVKRVAKRASGPAPVAPVLWRFAPASCEALGIHVDAAGCWYGNDAGDVFAIGHDGAVQAAYKLPGAVWCIVADDVWRYAGCNDGNVYDLTGRTPRVAYTIGKDEQLCWLLISRGRLAVSDEDAVITVFDHEGERRWRKATGGSYGWLLRTDGQTIFHGNTSGVAAYDWARGKRLWQRKTAAEAQLGWLEGDTLYVPTNGRLVQTFRKDGAQGITLQGDRKYLPTCAVAPGGTRIYVTDDAEAIYCFDDKGRRLWKLRTGAGGAASTQYFDGKLYIVTWKGAFICVDVSEAAVAAALRGRVPRARQIKVPPRTAVVSAQKVAQQVKTTRSVGKGVLLECVREGSKLRVRVRSKGFNPKYNTQFPRALRAAGARFVVDSVREVEGGGFYRAYGEIKKLVE